MMDAIWNFIIHHWLSIFIVLFATGGSLYGLKLIWETNRLLDESDEILSDIERMIREENETST